jgi:hypothetical protein
MAWSIVVRRQSLHNSAPLEVDIDWALVSWVIARTKSKELQLS